MSPTEGSWWMVTDEHGNDMPMEEYIASLKSQLNAVQDQADKQIVIWFGDAVPTASTEPASEWMDESTKEMHLHDIYYNRSYAETGGGRAYSFEKNPDNTYAWKEITDADVLKSLEAAQRAQDTADGKRRMFVREQPVPPYDKGDQWSNATHEDKYQNDLLVCVKSRGKDDEFDIDDWVSAQQYTTKQFESSLNVADKRIDAVISDFSSGLERVGFHLDGENSTFDVVADRFRVVTTTGVVSFFTSEGKLDTDFLDAKQIVTDGLRAGNIDAKNARIWNIVVEGDSSFKGNLDGVSGSFQTLTCFNKNGEQSGRITFFEDSVGLNIEGDIYLVKPRTRLSKRFVNTLYADNLVTLGSFSHFRKTVAVVTNETMIVYQAGKEVEHSIKLEKSPLSRDRETYLIPLCWGLPHLETPKDVINGVVAIDVVVFNCDRDFSYSFSNLGGGKEWTVINGNDKQSIYVNDISGLYRLEGGVTCKYVYVDPRWIRPHDGNQLAPGVFRSGSADLNWT